MKFIPILFSTPMVTAILEGRKTVTRRIMSPQIKACEHHLYLEAEWKDKPTEWVMKDGFAYCGLCGNGVTPKYEYKGIKAKAMAGDVLWVREKWKRNAIPMGWPFHYFALNDTFTNPEYEKWKPGIHMPKQACRLFLQVESAKVERLQDITEEDAIKEGVVRLTEYKDHIGGERLAHWTNYLNEGETPRYAYDSFTTLWQSINGEESWNENPFVWRIEFKRIEQPEGFLNSPQNLAKRQRKLNSNSKVG